VTGKTLVAGIGNIFLGDDGFGVEVATRLAGVGLPDGVRVVDYGIRGMHLAYDLANGYDVAILIDAAPRGGAPGTIYVIEPDLAPGPADVGAASRSDSDSADSDSADAGSSDADGGHRGSADADGPSYGEGVDAVVASPLFDAHGMQPDVVFGMLDMLDGGRPGRILIVGCEPASVDYGMGLSDAVAASVDEAVQVVLELVATECEKREEDQGVTAADAQGASGRSQLFMEGWTHVPRHSR
jgi:hydrogenase maturation protease